MTKVTKDNTNEPINEIKVAEQSEIDSGKTKTKQVSTKKNKSSDKTEEKVVIEKEDKTEEKVAIEKEDKTEEKVVIEKEDKNEEKVVIEKEDKTEEKVVNNAKTRVGRNGYILADRNHIGFGF
jgi:UDP-3-O-[3-hydroxymyristoyl] glucosamine N-acyltransferase